MKKRGSRLEGLMVGVYSVGMNPNKGLSFWSFNPGKGGKNENDEINVYLPRGGKANGSWGLYCSLGKIFVF